MMTKELAAASPEGQSLLAQANGTRTRIVLEAAAVALASLIDLVERSRLLTPLETAVYASTLREARRELQP